MTSPVDETRILNLDALLLPIPGSVATGTDLRESTSPQSIYFRLKDARAAARSAERAADEGRAAASMPPEWSTVSKLAQEVISKESKDLEIACWLLEALVRTHGFGGMREGLLLLTRLVSTYWGSLHSLKDDDGLATTVAPLTGLNGVDRDGALIQPLRKVPLTSRGDAVYAAYHYEQGVALAQVTDKAARERRIAAGVPTLEMFEQALRSSPLEFLRALLRDLDGSIAALTALTTVLIEKCGADAPPTSKIRETLESVRDLVRGLTIGLFPPEPTAPPVNETTDADARATNGSVDTEGHMSGDITSREDALRVLAKVSAYFRAAEPHSPIAFTLDDVIRRARMTLPELLTELLPDANARRAFLTSAGIKPTAETAPPAAGQK